MSLRKTPELTGPALDWAVAKCEGRKIEFNYQYTEETKFDGWWQLGPNHWQPLNSYSTDWAQGGPIIEREFITVGPYHDKAGKPTGVFQAYIGWDVEQLESLFQCDGPTPLIAAMRCFVVSKLGHEVDVPEELV